MSPAAQHKVIPFGAGGVAPSAGKAGGAARIGAVRPILLVSRDCPEGREFADAVALASHLRARDRERLHRDITLALVWALAIGAFVAGIVVGAA